METDIHYLEAMAICLGVCHSTPWLERIANDVRSCGDILKEAEDCRAVRKMESFAKAQIILKSLRACPDCKNSMDRYSNTSWWCEECQVLWG